LFTEKYISYTTRRMFGRKKYKGSVQIVGDDDDLVGRDDYTESNSEHVGSSDMNGVDSTTMELRGMQLREAEKGKLETERALRQALETRELGVETAKKLDSQTEQLEKNSRDLAYTHEKLDQAENVIFKMKTPKMLRRFRRKPKSGKGLKEAKVGRKETKRRDELRRKGTSSITVDGYNDGDSGDENELSTSGEDEDAPHMIREDYSEYDEPVRQVLLDQDKNLDLISQVIKDTNELAQAMGNELDLQGGLIDQVNDEVQSTRERTKKMAENIKEM